MLSIGEYGLPRRTDGVRVNRRGGRRAVRAGHFHRGAKTMRCSLRQGVLFTDRACRVRWSVRGDDGRGVVGVMCHRRGGIGSALCGAKIKRGAAYCGRLRASGVARRMYTAAGQDRRREAGARRCMQNIQKMASRRTRRAACPGEYVSTEVMRTAARGGMGAGAMD